MSSIGVIPAKAGTHTWHSKAVFFAVPAHTPVIPAEAGTQTGIGCVLSIARETPTFQGLGSRLRGNDSVGVRA